MSNRHLRAVPDQPHRPGRAVLYVRVSALMGRAEGSDDFHSPAIQVEAARRLVESSGLREVAVIDDDIDVSGTTFSRKGLDRIREMVQAGQVDVVALHDLSRLGRDLLESLQFIRWLRDHQVVVMSAQERIDDSPEGQYFLQQFLGMAELRARQIGRGWANVIARRRREGRYHGPVPPSGYVFGEDGRLVVHPTHGPAVTEAFGAFAAGKTLSAVRRQLAAATGTGMDAATFKKLLRKRVYLGEVGDNSRAHQPLIDQQTWEKVQRRLVAYQGTPSRILEARYSLTGLGRCATCEGRCIIHADSRDVRVRCALRSERRDPTRTCAGCGGLLLADVETEVLAQAMRYVEKLRHDVAASAARVAQMRRATGDAEAVRRELADIKAAMVKLTERWGKGRVPDQVYEATMDRYAESQTVLEARLVDLEETADLPPVAETVQLAEHLVAMWPQMLPHERNAVLRKLVQHVLIKPAAYYRQPAAERVIAAWR